MRDYLETLDWNKTAPGPHLPTDVIEMTSAKYREAFRRLTATKLPGCLRARRLARLIIPMSLRLAFLLLFGVFATFFARFVRGEVIFLMTTPSEAGVGIQHANARLSNANFPTKAALSSAELASNLSVNHKAWLNTWNRMWNWVGRRFR